MRALLLVLALASSGCTIGRTCKMVTTPMYWSDGSMSQMQLQVCHPRLTLRWK